ncbi:C4-dicarboxylate ABC transporter substrate-binding protein [Arcobacter sp. F155]|uniref:TRAP transporter small permease n=1 Tax=Arcobacter sp. F155 TaxID=2044512 RepID=UPI00100BE643|nr:TRAP transporter small permease [Arcobacter sp. F155]RXJ78069.1 C4-dicarboxylate ABC transporter substrate-binding protein [Arcobacter sp. F155]
MTSFTKKLDKIILILASIILLCATSMLIFAVFYRYVVIDFLGIYLEEFVIANTIYEFFTIYFDTLSATTDEIPGYLLVWLSFLGAYLAERENLHIKFDLLVDSLPTKLKNLFQMIPTIMSIIFFALLFYFSIKMIDIDGSTYIETIDIYQGVFMMIFPIASFILIIALSINIYKEYKCIS